MGIDHGNACTAGCLEDRGGAQKVDGAGVPWCLDRLLNRCDRREMKGGSRERPLDRCGIPENLPREIPPRESRCRAFPMKDCESLSRDDRAEAD